MKNYYYSSRIEEFTSADPQRIIGTLALAHHYTLEPTQRDAWLEQISILQSSLAELSGTIYFEYSIPRMGRRVDVIVLIGPVIFVLEFKIGDSEFKSHAIDQVYDYALDLKHFHEASHEQHIAPVLVATLANATILRLRTSTHNDKLFEPISCNATQLEEVIRTVLQQSSGKSIASSEWESGRYRPTPTIIEAAKALYHGHSVAELSRSDAAAINLSQTSDAISKIISEAKRDSKKCICFVTGVPGAGKTLVGLNIATQHFDKQSELYSVFLSGNGPLVDILREALARDRVRLKKESGLKIKKGTALSEVKAFIQNVHHFRDACLVQDSPPVEHVALFDEAQRAWNMEQTAKFMQRKRNKPGFIQSEPEFLISCLDRHQDWAVVVCLVGGGQEINTGEAGIAEWIASLNRSFPHWEIHISSNFSDSEYGADQVLNEVRERQQVVRHDELHLSVSMRSFRAENLSLLVKQLLDLDRSQAQATLASLQRKYPIVITRDLQSAKQWLRQQARGTERYGIVVSSQAERLKPFAIDVKTDVDPVHWFLDDKDDVRSSYYLEDVATEFDIQGLELDWVCVTWDADFRYTQGGWQHWSFAGNKWQKINKSERRIYQKNAYRVLLTRARQGMVIVVPPGDAEDHTRNNDFYDPTFEYLKEIGFQQI